VWLFGYGSLIFRPSFEYLERRRAFVRGWERRFWQGSPDHRGVPEAPGRVVTLVENANAICGGVAYRIDVTESERILAALDHREVAGFVRHDLSLFDDADSTDSFASGITWVANSENAHFLGPLAENEIARFVRDRRGPSGENTEYVLLLAAALAELRVTDPHVEAIAKYLVGGVAADDDLR